MGPPPDDPASFPFDSAQIAQTVARLTDDLRAARQRTEKAEAAARGASPEIEALVGRALLHAQRMADEAIAAAEQRAAARLAEADQRASHTVTSAKQSAEAMLAQAHDKAEAMLATARLFARKAFDDETEPQRQAIENLASVYSRLHGDLEESARQLEVARQEALRGLDEQLAELTLLQEPIEPDVVDLREPAPYGNLTSLPHVPARGNAPPLVEPRPVVPRLRVPSLAMAAPAPAPPEAPVQPAPAAPAFWSPPPEAPVRTPRRSPDARYADLSAARLRAARGFGWLRNAGILTLMFVAFQLWGTGVSQARSQQALRAALRTDVPTLSGSGSRPATGGTAAKGSSKGGAPSIVLDGGAVALIEIPKIGVTQAVVEGTTVDDLHKGPGHYSGSAMPGQIGNVAIAGHRTTYGAPFARLNELHVNDVIYLTSKAGRYRYVVSKDPFVVLPTQREVVNPTPDAELTLTTCHPRYEASRRLIVNAHLAPDSATPAQAVAGSPLPGVGPTVLKAAVSAADAQITQFDFFVLPMCIFWGLLMIYAWFAATRLAERWAKYSAWLLATPVLMFLLWEFFTAVNQFLPAYV